MTPKSRCDCQFRSILASACFLIWHLCLQDFQAFKEEVSKVQGLPDGVLPVDMSVVRRKTFPMDPITVEEVSVPKRSILLLIARVITLHSETCASGRSCGSR